MVTAEKPQIRCKYRNSIERQCPLEALPNSDFCFFHQR